MPPTTRRTRSAAQKAEKAEAAKPYAAPVESATKQRAVTRKPRAKKKAPIPTPESDESLPDAGADANAGADEEEKEEEEITDKPSYWLMKAEPETRIENGIDVKFSIDDLAAREEPEPWDGEFFLCFFLSFFPFSSFPAVSDFLTRSLLRKVSATTAQGTTSAP